MLFVDVSVILKRVIAFSNKLTYFFLSYIDFRAICFNLSKFYIFKVTLFKLKIKYHEWVFVNYKVFSKDKSFYLQNSVQLFVILNRPAFFLYKHVIVNQIINSRRKPQEISKKKL